MITGSNEDEDKKAEVQETFRNKLKRRGIQIFFELTKDRNVSLGFAAAMIIISLLQLISYAYYRKAGFPFKDDLYSTISNVADYIRLYPAIEAAKNAAAYYVLLFFLLFFLLAYIAQILYVDYCCDLGKFFFDFPVKALKVMSFLLYWVLLQPSIETFGSILSCNNNYHIVDTALSCWGGIHIFYCFLFIIALILYIGIGLTIAFLYNESRANSMDAFARLDNSLELYFFCYRIFLGVISHFCTDNAYHWLLIVVHIIGSFWFLVLYIRYLPFYNSKLSIIYGICISSYFWVAINLLILKLMENMNYSGQSIIIIIGILIIIPLIINLRDKLVYNILFESRYDKIKEEHELDIYIKKVLDLVTDQSRNEVEELILLGFMNNHKSECSNPSCPLNNKEDLYLPSSGATMKRSNMNMKDPILVYHVLNAIFQVYSKTSNFGASLHIIYSYFLFTYMGNIHMAIIELDIAEKMDISLQQMFTIFRSKRLIESYLISKYKKKNDDPKEQRSYQNLDVTIVITFENLYAKLLKSIEKSANDHIEFWSHLDSLLPDLNMLHKLGLNITTSNRQTAEIWMQLIKINSSHHKALKNYGYYLKDIRNDEESGTECLEKAKVLKFGKSIDERINDFDIMFADDTAIIVISAGNKDNQGKITRTNAGITNLFRYNPLEVTGQDVNILMPPIIAAKHNQFMERYFFTGKEKVINNERELFAMPRTGSLICISSIVKHIPSLKDDIQYIGLIRQRNKDDDYILTNSQGKIDSMSESLAGKFRFHPSFFKENEVYVQFLCPELLALEHDKEGKLITSLELLSGYQELTFILPKDFHFSIQGFSKNVNITRQDTTSEKDNNEIKSDENQVTLETPEGKKEENAKIPETIKKIAKLMHGNDYKKHLDIHRSLLEETINYDNYELKERWIVEIKHIEFGDGKLKVNIFRIMTHKGQDSANSEKIYGVKSTPSKTRARPEEVKRLKSVGLDPEKKQDQPNIEHKEDNKSSLAMQTMEEDKKEILHDSTKKKDLQPPQFDASPIQPGQNLGGDPDASLTSLTDAKAGFTSSRNPSGIVTQSNQLPSSGVRQTDQQLPENKETSKQGLEHANEIPQPQADVSMALNMSQAEALPLNAPQGTGIEVQMRKIPSSRDQFLRKPPHGDFQNEEQEAVIRNLLRETAGKECVEIKDKENEPKKEKAKAVQIQEDDTGSVASRTKSLMKHIRALRSAVYEQYSPRSVLQMKYVAMFVFIVLVVITLIYFIIARDLYGGLKSNVENLYFSNDRLIYSTAIGASVRALILMNKYGNEGNITVIDLTKNSATDYYKDGFEGNSLPSTSSMDYRKWNLAGLEESAKDLKSAQNGLSTSSFAFSDEHYSRINPEIVSVEYREEVQMAGVFNLDCWSSIMGLVVHALKVKEMELKEITMEEPSVYYVVQNSFNNILAKIYGSTDAIKDESSSAAETNRTILMILLLVASCAILISVVLIVRVAVMVSYNKEDILKLFIDIPQKSVKQQLSKCRKYFLTFRDSDRADIGDRDLEVEEEEEEKKNDGKEAKDEKKEDGNNDEEKSEGDEDNNEENEKRKNEKARLIDDDDEGDLGKTHHRQGKKKKFKPYSTQLVLLLIKFTFFVALLEVYFLASYFESASFLSQSISIIKEITVLCHRTFSNGYLLRAFQEFIGTNGLSTAEFERIDTYVLRKIHESVDIQESFLRQHSENIGINSNRYNDFFDNLVYSDACNALYYIREDILECQQYSVLQKGMHSANIAFWDSLRSTLEDFMKLEERKRNMEEVKRIFDDAGNIQNSRMENRYFTYAYKRLLNMLDEDLYNKFQNENSIILIMFIVYMIFLFLLYFFVWNLFVESTRDSLWITKCMLGIIPVNTIMEVKNIREFLINSSKGLMLSLGSD